MAAAAGESDALEVMSPLLSGLIDARRQDLLAEAEQARLAAQVRAPEPALVRVRRLSLLLVAIQGVRH